MCHFFLLVFDYFVWGLLQFFNKIKCYQIFFVYIQHSTNRRVGNNIKHSVLIRTRNICVCVCVYIYVCVFVCVYECDFY